MKTIRTILPVVLLVAIVLTTHAASELRTWTARSGAQISAKFVELKGTDVVLESADGKQLAIRLNLLSDPDQEFVRGQVKTLPAAAAAAGGLAKDPNGLWEAGKISKPIATAKDAQWSYLLYVPKSFDPSRKWPVLFIITGAGGDAPALEKFVAGAETCGWILAMSVQARYGFYGNEDATGAMVDDVEQRLPVNPQRQYAAGFYSGCWSAFWLASTRTAPPLAGVLAICGGTTEPDKVPKNITVYGLCGSNSFGRWAVACLFRDLQTPVKHLRAYIGDTNLLDADCIQDGMIWLNYVYLQGTPATDYAAAQEKETFTKKLQQGIDTLKDSNPERAYEWAQTLSTGAGGTAIRSFNPQLQALLNNPRIKKYATGQKDLWEYIKKHFTADSSLRPNPETNGTKAAREDAEKLAEIYKGSYLEDLFKNFGRPAK